LWVAVVVAAIVTTGCVARGAVTAGAGSGVGSATAGVGHPVAPPATSPSPSPTLVGPSRLTVADNGTTVRLVRGRSLTVELAAQGMFSWHVPITTGTALRLVNGSGGYPTEQPARATFVATEPGTAVLTATDDTACLQADPECLPLQQQWHVSVVVG
jgi:hypothetical protein